MTSITLPHCVYISILQELTFRHLLQVFVSKGQPCHIRALTGKKMPPSAPSEFVTYKVVKKLYDLNIISRATFLSFLEKFENLTKKVLRKHSSYNVYWDDVRDLFDYTDDVDVIPMNAANLSPSFHAVQVLVNNLGLDMNKDVSIQRRMSVFATIIDEARELIAGQLNISTDELAFTRNTTEANSIITNGLDFNADAGEEVVIWSENHGTLNLAWDLRKPRYNNFNIVTVYTTGATTDQELIDRFVAQVKPGVTRVVTFSEVGNSGKFLFMFSCFPISTARSFL